MKAILVSIERFVDDHPPGWIECQFIDADGCRHRFVEKGPVVSERPLLHDSYYPQQGSIACVVDDESVDGKGRTLVRVCTQAPWGVESVDGKTLFTVERRQIADSGTP